MSEAQRQAEQIEQQREKQFERQKQQTALQQAFNDQGELKESWMEDILDVDELTKRLQPNTIAHIQGSINKQMILSNLSSAQVHDRWWYLEIMKYKIYSVHPPEDSLITGKTRAFLMDDPQEELMPLSQQERNTIDQIIRTLQNAITRSKGGFERKQLNTSINRAETEGKQQEESSGMFSGLFGN